MSKIFINYFRTHHFSSFTAPRHTSSCIKIYQNGHCPFCFGLSHAAGWLSVHLIFPVTSSLSPHISFLVSEFYSNEWRKRQTLFHSLIGAHVLYFLRSNVKTNNNFLDSWRTFHANEKCISRSSRMNHKERMEKSLYDIRSVDIKSILSYAEFY